MMGGAHSHEQTGAQQACGYTDTTAEPEIDWDKHGGHLHSEGGKMVSGCYYETYHGHTIPHLARARAALASQGCRRFVYLCGDSSLDNKHWFFDGGCSKKRQMQDPGFTAPAVNGYEQVLERPARMVQDVSFHMNDLAAQRYGPGKVCTLMTAVEESTIEDRGTDGLLMQDAFIRDHITPRDALVVSVGGNDVALRPTLRTIANMALLTRSPDCMIRNGTAPGLGYFIKLFHGRIEALLRRVLAKQRPAKVLVCMIYYPDTQAGGSWADTTLRLLGYDSNPAKLQLIIRTLFDRINKRGFSLPPRGQQGDLPETETLIETVALYNVLTESRDYVQRVEPSVAGGRKMAAAFLDALALDAGPGGGEPGGAPAGKPPN